MTQEELTFLARAIVDELEKRGKVVPATDSLARERRTNWDGEKSRGQGCLDPTDTEENGESLLSEQKAKELLLAVERKERLGQSEKL